MIHLICGPIGSGKTTLANNLSNKYGAVKFSEDEWLNNLFIPDAPEGLLNEPMEIIGAWASEKYNRSREQIWQVCDQLLAKNISIILDGASANKEQRDIIRKKAKNHKVGFQLHYINAENSTRKERVKLRNKNKGDTYSIEVSDQMFNYMETFFIHPDFEELKEARIY